MHLLAYVADIASIAGLGFSILAWRTARGARDAAREARDAVRRDNAREEVEA